MSEDHNNSPNLKGHPLAVDPIAQSNSLGEPAFVARPDHAPLYHGFPILDDVTIDGFVLGKITDFEAEECEEGDAFIVAPDNSRAGLVWKHSQDKRFEEVLPLEPNRWGVWPVSLPFPMTNRDNARQNLGIILEQLRRKWEDWRTQFGRPTG